MFDNILDKYNKTILDDLTIEQKIEQAATIRMMEHMEPSEKIKLSKAIIDYYKSKVAFAKMQDLTESINQYLIDNRNYKGLEEKILELPKNRLILPEDTKSKEIYEEYKNSIYNLVLYLNFKGNRTLLDESNEIKEIVERRAEFDYLNMDLEKKGEQSREKSSELKKIIPAVPIFSIQGILKDIYVYKNKDNIMFGEFDEELNKKRIEVVATKGEVASNKSILKKLGKKIALFTAITIGGLSVGLIAGSKIGKLIGKEKLKQISVVSVDIDTPDGTIKNTLDFDDVEFKNKILQKYLNTERRYVTVYGEKIDNLVEVKVYDYTDVDITNEELKTIELDDSNLIYSAKCEYNKLIKEDLLYGQYTGEAHRDVATVNYYSLLGDTNNGYADEEEYIKSEKGFFAFIFLLMTIALEFPLYNKLINELSEDYKRRKFHYTVLLDKLQRLLEDVEALQVRKELNAEINKLHNSQPVDNELNEYTTITR